MRRTMPKASSMPELTAIREGGCTYADACLRVGIAKSTFQRWKVKGQEQARGQFCDFCDLLEEAEVTTFFLAFAFLAGCTSTSPSSRLIPIPPPADLLDGFNCQQLAHR